MAPIVEQIVSLLSTPEGFLIYSLVLGLCTFATLISCLYAEGNQLSPVGKKMQLGLLVLFIADLVLLISASLGWLRQNDGQSYLPPLDSYLALFSLVIIIWLWVSPEPNHQIDLIALIVAAITVLFGIMSIILWMLQNSGQSYNATLMAGVAYYTGLILLIVGIILLALRRPTYWGFGVAMLAILFLGYLVQILIGGKDADYGWYVHLAEMMAFIILLGLPQRLADLRQAGGFTKDGTITQITEKTVDDQVIQSLISLLSEPAPQEHYRLITQMAAYSTGADYCLLLLPQKSGEQLFLPVGYNRKEDKQIEGRTSSGPKMPTLMEALNSGNVLRLSADKGSELPTFAEEFGLGKPGHLMMVPFHPKGTNVVMALAVISGSIGNAWSDEDAASLMKTNQLLVSIAGQYSKGGTLQSDQLEMNQKLQRAQAQTDQAKLEYAQLKAKYDSVTSAGAISAPLAVGTAVIVESQKSLQDTISQLETRNRELEQLVARGRPSVEEVEQLRQELRSALVDLARIPSTLSKSDQKMLEMQLSTVKHLDDMQATELVNSIAQEFRQPLSSIIGYTDLLLGESVGLLGAVQRKFVERVKAAAERLGILLNELIQVMSIDGGRVDQSKMSVDLKSTIDEAVGNISAQIKEKNINLRVELPDNPPQVLVNKDAMLQIIENLLENAYLITPTDGQIRLLGRLEPQDNMQGYIHISVSDQGGGIEKTDISRVFLRRYKMENPHIQGIGDIGVGLSIVKSLVELNKGRVWVDSSEGAGSTFSVLLPITENPQSQENPTPSSG